MKHHHYAVATFSLLVLGLLGYYAFINQPSAPTFAGSADNASGWAWSSNIGWVSFNCVNVGSCSLSNYGVDIDDSTGLFSGYAWSDNIGWISFNQADLSGCPASSCEARVGDIGSDVYPKLVSGWAKVLSSNSWMSLKGEITTTTTETTETSDAEGWASKASIPTVRSSLASASIDNIIYVLGGYNPNSFWVSKNEAYNVTDNTWTTKAPMPTPRSSLGAVVVDGNIYAIGGHNTSSAFGLNTNEVYDVINDQWVSRAPMPSRRAGLGVAYVDGKIYAIGGWYQPNQTSGNVTLAINEVYDPQTNSWTTKASMPEAKHDMGVAVVDGKIYVFGGWTSSWFSKTVHFYDPQTDTWTRVADMPIDRAEFATAVVNNKIYAIGGDRGTGDLNLVEQYDTETNQWTSKMSMPTARQNLTTSSASNGKIYAIGGLQGVASYPSANEEYTTGVTITTTTTTTTTEPYGVQLESSGDLTGWSWEPDVVGWTSWSGDTYGVFTTAHLETLPPPPGGDGNGGGSGGSSEVPPTPGAPREVRP